MSDLILGRVFDKLTALAKQKKLSNIAQFDSCVAANMGENLLMIFYPRFDTLQVLFIDGADKWGPMKAPIHELTFPEEFIHEALDVGEAIVDGKHARIPRITMDEFKLNIPEAEKLDYYLFDTLCGALTGRIMSTEKLDKGWGKYTEFLKKLVKDDPKTLIQDFDESIKFEDLCFEYSEDCEWANEVIESRHSITDKVRELLNSNKRINVFQAIDMAAYDHIYGPVLELVEKFRQKVRDGDWVTEHPEIIIPKFRDPDFMESGLPGSYLGANDSDYSPGAMRFQFRKVWKDMPGGTVWVDDLKQLKDFHGTDIEIRVVSQPESFKFDFESF